MRDLPDPAPASAGDGVIPGGRRLSPGAGSISDRITGGNDSARIERLDRKLLWTLDQKARTYTECALKGCPAPTAANDKQNKAKSEKQEQPHEPHCKLSTLNVDVWTTQGNRELRDHRHAL